jgi:hypothetical protein
MSTVPDALPFGRWLAKFLLSGPNDFFAGKSAALRRAVYFLNNV